MEPLEQKPQFGPELPPPQPGQSYEQFPPSQTPEVAPDNRPERREQQPAPGSSQSVNDAAAPVLPPVVPTPDLTVDDQGVAATNDNPVVANDDDLIEKEWVDKAKQIIAQTKDDPYRREMEVNKLQADYLYKRYGRELGSSQ